MLSTKSVAQEVYIIDDMSIKKLDIGTGTCITTSISTTCADSAFSIALIRDTLYYIYNDKIYKSVRENNVFTNCNIVGTIPFAANSLVVGEGGMLFFALGNSLYRMDPRTGESVNLGLMPFSSSGDLVYYKGILFMASENGLVKVNTVFPSASSLHIPIPNNSMYGLASIPVNCNTNRVFGLMIESNIPGSSGTKVVELDMENKQLLTVTCFLPFMVMDAASVVENGDVQEIEIHGFEIRPDCKDQQLANVQVLYSGSGDYTFQLDDGTTSRTGSFTVNGPGNYPLHIISPNGCNKDTAFDVMQIPQRPSFTTIVRQPTCEFSDQVRIQMQPFYPGYLVEHKSGIFATAHVFQSLGAGDHKFTFTDPYGCRLDSANINIIRTEGCDTLFFPNAFTPNNDGKNDVFKPGDRFVKEFTISIFNRWGQRVFSSNNIQHGWDGTINGKKQGPGVFVWVSGYTTANGFRKQQKGTVVLIR